MPVLDTEVLFALNPKERLHRRALSRLAELRAKGLVLHAPDTAMLEFQIVLRSIAREPHVVRRAVLALRRALQMNGVTEIFTLDSELIANQCEIEQKHGLSYFDSLIAASTLRLDRRIVSDDASFEKVPGIVRTTLS